MGGGCFALFVRALAIAVIGLGGLSMHPALATLSQVSSRAALGANLIVNWNTFGPAGSVLSCYCSESEGPISVAINASSGNLWRVDEGVDYTGNFAPGASLLVQQFTSDAFFISFSTPVSAVGLQVQPISTPNLALTGPFSTTMFVGTNDAMDASFSVSGNSTLAQDNSAPFIGVVSTRDDITNLIFYPPTSNLAINELSVRVPAFVPEPAALSLLAPGIMLCFGLRRGRSLRRRLGQAAI